MIFILRFFNFRIIREFMISRVSVLLSQIAYLNIGVFIIGENFEFARQRIRDY